MTLQTFWDSLEASPVGDFVSGSAWAFPTIESVHVIALVTVVGTVAIMDLRLLGLASGSWTATQLSRDTLRWTWLGFVVAAITGTLLFVSKAHIYAREPWFLGKLALIALAGVNMAVFHALTWKRVADWDSARSAPMAAKIAGGLSLACWVLAVFFGRWIGFTLGHYE
jgi:hypothetical protein